MPLVSAVTVAACLVPALAAAQAPPSAPQPSANPGAVPPAPSATAPAAGAAAQAKAPEPYTYNPVGRRDPFISLVASGTEPRTPGKGGQGLAGLTTAEIAVRGVLLSQGSYVAMVQAPDTKTYIVHVNDRLIDGTVKSISSTGLVIVQEVNDPLSLIKQREVRKGLTAIEGAK